MIGLGRLLVFLFVCGGGFVFLVLLFDVLDLSVVSFVYLSQLTLRYNACHYRDDERSISPKKSVSQDITASVFFVILNVIGASFSLIECASCQRYLEPNGFSAPILLFTCTLNGSLVSDTLPRRINLFSNLFD